MKSGKSITYCREQPDEAACVVKTIEGSAIAGPGVYTREIAVIRDVAMQFPNYH